jgi:hypothetical protein
MPSVRLLTEITLVPPGGSNPVDGLIEIPNVSALADQSTVSGPSLVKSIVRFDRQAMVIWVGETESQLVGVVGVAVAGTRVGEGSGVGR